MLRKLRVLLIAAATLATVLVGLREVLADARGVGCAIRCLGGYDGSREDDSGTLAEQAEGDDVEEELDREIPIQSLASPTCSLVASVSRAVLAPPCLAVHFSRGDVRSRGPPAAA